MEVIFDFLDVLTEKVLPPILLVILGISGMILISGIPSIRHIPRWRITGWLSICSMVLVISFPYVYSYDSDWLRIFFLSLPEFIHIIVVLLASFLFFLAPFLTLALATIFLSRAFMYVARTVRPVLSWALIFLLSLGSGVFFTVLYWFSWRAMEGEGRLLPSFVGTMGGIFVLFSVFYLGKANRQENLSGTKNTKIPTAPINKVEKR